jgi:CHASE3 domain sensor protein
MNTSSKPYLSGQSAEAKSVTSPEAITDTARGAVDAVKNTMSDAVDRGQHALSQASEAANEMMETATHQVKTFASELDAMAKRNPLGTIVGAVVIGILIGFLARGRA